MSANDTPVTSFILPSTDRLGLFRCGVCWSTGLVVNVAVKEDKVVVRLICPICGNIKEWQVNYGS